MTGITLQAGSLDQDWHSLTVGGEVDLATVEQFESSIDDVLSNGAGHLVVDLRNTAFMDSTGLRALVMGSRRFTEVGRSFAIAVGGGPVSRLIDLSGVRDTLTVVDEPTDLLD